MESAGVRQGLKICICTYKRIGGLELIGDRGPRLHLMDATQD